MGILSLKKTNQIKAISRFLTSKFNKAAGLITEKGDNISVTGVNMPIVSAETAKGLTKCRP